MTSQQGAAYINAQVACAMIEAMGMVAQNALCASKSLELPYRKSDFEALIEKYGIHHNAVHGFLFYDPPNN